MSPRREGRPRQAGGRGEVAGHAPDEHEFLLGVRAQGRVVPRLKCGLAERLFGQQPAALASRATLLTPYAAGDAYYGAPGHLPLLFAGTELVEFSPTGPGRGRRGPDRSAQAGPSRPRHRNPLARRPDAVRLRAGVRGALEMMRIEVTDGTIAEVTIYCTGDRDEARQAEHAAAVTPIRP
jgi:hypothetical protein